MKITPDYKGRNDEYDEHTVRYWESVDDKGYIYELYVMVDGVKSAIIVTDDGVSIDCRDGENCGASVHTNVVPKSLFPNQKELSWDNLVRIIRILEITNGEGYTYTAEDMRALYNKWKSLGSP